MLTSERSRDGLVGQVLDDRYEVVGKLARGGMATVYLAHDLRLSREVAIKIMNEGLGDSDEFARRFDAEARAAAHLSHQNVVSVFDQGSDDGRPYIVMEYIKGCTLRQLITREAPMEPDRVLGLLEPVASALAAAHAAGIIHRDVKPENVLISDRGEVKVADFGLARAVTANSHAATTGLVLGTVSYIAPELVTKGRADARSDVYSLGIVAYEMLTGRKPHTGDEPIQVAYSHVHNQVPPPSLELSTTWRGARIPPYVDAFVTTAANRDRPLRPLDAGVLLAHLRDAREALARGIADDPALTARMRRTHLPGDELTAEVTPLTSPSLPAERRFTPVTPVSPSFDVSSDGAPFYSDGPVPYSPQSPLTRSVPTLPGATEAAQGRRRGPRWLRIASLLVTLAVLTGVGWGGWYLLEGRWTTTPPMVALAQPDAQAAAAQVGVGVVIEEEYSETVSIGRVTRTIPDAGQRVLRDGVITVWISLGLERYDVPNVVGATLDAAKEQLAGRRLVAGDVVDEYDDTAPAGQVLTQGTPVGEQVKRDTPVDLTVSKGPAPVEYVDFSGKPRAELTSWAETNLITVHATEEHHDSVASGAVISQNPASGSTHRGGEVTVVVSKGPVLVQIPRGLVLQGAESVKTKLEALGFKTEYKKLLPNTIGLVHGLEPGEGTMAPKGSTVVIRIV